MTDSTGPDTLYTIGHSNRSREALLALLEAHVIGQLIDIRRRPGSRRLPHFNQQALQQALTGPGTAYFWLGESLGGHRGSNHDHGNSPLPDSLRGFAEYMNTAAFRNAILALRQTASEHNSVIMCAENLPEHCHRQLISDYLGLQGMTVRHIVDRDTCRQHVIHPGARLDGDRIHYDRGTQGRLDLA